MKELIAIKRFKYLPYILIGMLGLAIAGISFYFLNNKYVGSIKTKDILVTAREIPMYEIIKKNDLKTIQVPVKTNTDNYLTDYTDIVGKVAKVPLSSNDLIAPDFLLGGEEIKNTAFITINTLYAKTSDAKPGDTVDVYKVMTGKESWTEENQTILVAKDAVVVSVTTTNGKVVEKSDRLLQGNPEKIGVVKLGVKPEYVKHLVSASVMVDNNYVLVVKSPYFQQEDVGKDPILTEILKQNEEREEDGELEDGGIIDEIIPEKRRENTERSDNRQN